MKHEKAYRTFVTALGIILICMSLLLLIVSPIGGTIGILCGIFIMVYGRKIGNQQVQKNKDIRRLPERYCPPKEVGKIINQIKER